MYIAESAKYCEHHYFCSRKSIVIFMPYSNDIYTKVLTMLEKVVQIVSVDERLDSTGTVDCSIGNALCGIRKKLCTTLFNTSNSILIFMRSTNDN